jgi:hypothetical protein
MIAGYPSRHGKEDRIEWLEVCDENAVNCQRAVMEQARRQCSVDGLEWRMEDEQVRKSDDGGEREELQGK